MTFLQYIVVGPNVSVRMYAVGLRALLCEMEKYSVSHWSHQETARGPLIRLRDYSRALTRTSHRRSTFNPRAVGLGFMVDVQASLPSICLFVCRHPAGASVIVAMDKVGSSRLDEFGNRNLGSRSYGSNTVHCLREHSQRFLLATQGTTDLGDATRCHCCLF